MRRVAPESSLRYIKTLKKCAEKVHSLHPIYVYTASRNNRLLESPTRIIRLESLAVHERRVCVVCIVYLNIKSPRGG